MLDCTGFRNSQNNVQASEFKWY